MKFDIPYTHKMEGAGNWVLGTGNWNQDLGHGNWALGTEHWELALNKNKDNLQNSQNTGMTMSKK